MDSMYQLNQIPSETKIKKYIRAIVFRKNMFCPECRSRHVTRYESRYRCENCRVKFSLISHTWLKGMKVPYQKFWLVLWCLSRKVSIQHAMSHSGLSNEAIRHWYSLFRAHIPEPYIVLERVVQLDEAYGKGWSLVMAKQKHSRKVAYTVLHERSVQRHHALTFLQQNVRPRTKLCTDGAAIYRNIDRWWPVRHETDIHKRFEFGKTSEIEGMFGNFRTFVRRMYHHATAPKIEEYVREFSARFSSPELFENPNTYLQKSLTLVPIDW